MADFYVTNLTRVNCKLEAIVITISVEVQFDHIILRYKQTTSLNLTAVETLNKSNIIKSLLSRNMGRDA